MLKLLVVDDNNRDRRVAREMSIWQDLNIQVIGEAANGHLALEQIEHLGVPDIVLTDVSMPYMDGMTLSKKLQQEYPRVHVSIPSPSLPAQTEGGMEEDQVRKYRNQVKRNIDYFEISEDYAANLEQLDEIVDLMVETLCSTRPTLSVAGDNLPASLVKERLLKINCMHIQYVMDSLKSNTTPVRNIKRYLLTVLFNAPATIDHYYSAQFRHEYYQQAQRSRAEG